ncbi:hypothetical protein EVG20_g11602 [Dentipellis fragilis]|uniref:Uncharacterized protein n=1 Tax=Dentipellis fragilis TaxID=205917 RepID=A0A4Y9XKT5_9AGAM|nr:hypothetical protein EVG20_g11602 [Dentipellis fragilis]
MRGSFTSLEDLEVAFKADAQDRALIDHITSSFPNLHLLQVHRYRAEGETAADVESALNHITQALSSLHYLRHFRMYLNLPEDDYRFKGPRPYGDIKIATRQEEFQELLQRYATLIAQHCGRALQMVDFLCTWVFNTRIWMRFYVERDDDDRLVVRFEEGSTYFLIYSDDTEGP